MNHFTRYKGNFNSISLKINPLCHTLSNADAMSKKIAHTFFDLINDSDTF